VIGIEKINFIISDNIFPDISVLINFSAGRNICMLIKIYTKKPY